MGLFSFLGGLLGLSSGPSQRIQVSKASAAAGLPIIYGRRRVTPVKVFKTVSRNNADAGSYAYDHSFITKVDEDYEETRKNYDFLHRVDVWGQGEITSIEKFWLDGDAATVTRFRSRPYFRALSNYGSMTQTAMTALSAASSRWTTAHRGVGVAYTWSRFYNSSKKPQFTAEPELKAEIKGLRVYDPRLDDVQTGGSGSQRATDATTWAYSENRALLVLDYLRGDYGFGAATDDIDYASFMKAANQCDATMTIPGRQKNETGEDIYGWWDREEGRLITIGQGQYFPTFRPRQVGTTQPRWHGAAVLDPTTGVVENLKLLLEGFGWTLGWSNGRHKLVLEDTVAGAVTTFGEDEIIGDWTSQRGIRENRLNRITVTFQNENKNFEEDTVSWPEKGSSVHTNFLVSDGGQDLHTNESVKTITDFYRAQAYAEFRVRKSRVAHRIEGMRLAPRALLLEPGDVIALDYAAKGFSGDDGLFIVERVIVSPTLEVSVDLLKYDEGVYNPDARTDEPLDNSMDIADLWLDPPAVAGLALVTINESKADGSVITGLDVTWQAPDATVGIDRIEVSWRVHPSTDVEDHTSDGLYTNHAYVARDVTRFHIPGIVDDRNYDVRVLYWTQRGQQSDEAVQTINVVAAASKLDGIDEGATRNEFRGKYLAWESYFKGDVVTYEGSSYVHHSEVSTSGINPTDETYWTLLASAGAPVLVEYSAEDPPSDPQVGSEWHTTFNAAADLYMRQTLGDGTWTEAMRIVGESGADGPYVDYRFTRSATTPTRSASSDNPGDEWEDSPPTSSNDPVWMISARKKADGTLATSATWSFPTKLTGDPGSAGGHYDFVFARGASAPGTPEGNDPAGDTEQVWEDGPPEANGTALWMSRGFLSSSGVLQGNWSTPEQIGGSGLEVQYSADASSWHGTFQTGDLYMRQRLAGDSWSAAYRIVGETGESLSVQYSANGTSNWSTTFNASTHLYMRQRLGTGSWSAAMRIVGESGDPGAKGEDGTWVDYRFRRQADQPDAVYGNTPSGWFDYPPTGTSPLWLIRGTKDSSDNLIGSWSTPIQLNGNDGEGGISVSLTNDSHTVTTAADGTGGDYSTAGGEMKLYVGTVEKTTGVSYSIPSKTSGLSITINGSSGVYTVTACSPDQATATLRATYSGQTFDKIYTIAKAKSGGGSTARSGVATMQTPSGLSSTNYIQQGNTIVMDVGPDGTVSGNFSINFNTSGSATVYGKMQYRPAGGSWSDLVPEVFETAPSEPGQVNGSRQISYSGNQTSYEFRMMLKKGGGGTVTITGSPTIKASWTNA